MGEATEERGRREGRRGAAHLDGHVRVVVELGADLLRVWARMRFG